MDTTQFNAIMLKVMVLTSGLIGVSGQLRMKPENVAAVVGTDVVLQCQGPTDDPDAIIIWYEYIRDPLRRSTISSRDTITVGIPNYDLYSISGDPALAQYHLNIDLEIVSGGRYECSEPIVPFQASAHITVLESDPVCSDTIQADGVVEEGEIITYTCVVTYNSTSIDWPPVMTWTGPNGTITDVTKLSTSGGRVTSSVDVTGASGLNEAVYSVRTHFEAYGGSLPADHATNVPTYSNSHSFDILEMHYNPRNIDFFRSDQNCQIPGSAIECRADGNPSPMYRWHNLTDNSTQYGPMLNITQSMLDSNHSFSCEAYNIIRGTERAVSKNITLTVSDASCSSGGLSVAGKIGIGVAAGVIGLGIVVIVVCVIVKKK